MSVVRRRITKENKGYLTTFNSVQTYKEGQAKA